MEGTLVKDIKLINCLKLIFFSILMSCSQNNNIAEFEIDGSIANYEKQLVNTSDPSAFTLLLVTDLVNFYRFNLNNFEKKSHTSAIMFALDHSKNGQLVSWHNKNRLARGNVRVLMSKFNKKGEFCRIFDSYIFLNGAEKGNTNTSCKNLEKKKWIFFK